MPVFIYGRAQDEPFSQRAETLNISANGGLLSLPMAEVADSQKLVVTNLQTDEDCVCRVVRLQAKEGKNFVGVEFLQPAPHFWSVDFDS